MAACGTDTNWSKVKSRKIMLLVLTKKKKKKKKKRKKKKKLKGVWIVWLAVGT